MDIYVGSIPFKMTENDIKALFEPFGEVTSVKIVINHITRQNKGFGFVQMTNNQEALAAIKALNGSEIEGRKILVSKSEPKKEATPAKKTGGYFKGIGSKKRGGTR